MVRDRGGGGNIDFQTAGSLVGTTSPSFDSSASSNILTAGNSTLTWSHTVNNGNERLLVVTLTYQTTAGPYTSVTYGGVALTQLDTQASSIFTTEIWYLKNPVIGTANIIAILTTSGLHAGGSSSWFNVDQVTTFGTVAKATGTSASPLVTVSSGTGQIVIDSLGKLYNADTVTSIQTLMYSVASNFATDSSNRRNASSRATGSASVNMGYTLSASRAWAIIGVSLLAGKNFTTCTMVSKLKIDKNGIGVFGAVPVAQQPGGVSTAGSSWTSNEQSMLQRVYDAIRTFGYMS